MTALEVVEKALKEEYERVEKTLKEADPGSEREIRLSGHLNGLAYAIGYINGTQEVLRSRK